MLVMEQGTDDHILIRFWINIWIQDFFEGLLCHFLAGVSPSAPFCWNMRALMSSVFKQLRKFWLWFILLQPAVIISTTWLRWSAAGAGRSKPAHFIVLSCHPFVQGGRFSTYCSPFLFFLCRSHGSFSVSSSRPTLSSTRGKCHSFFKVRVFTPNWRVSLFLHHYI